MQMRHRCMHFGCIKLTLEIRRGIHQLAQLCTVTHVDCLQARAHMNRVVPT